MNCRYDGPDRPRLTRSHLRDCDTAGCEGCLPCEEHHCAMPHCPGRHLERGEVAYCAACVANVGYKLARIGVLAERMPTEAQERGVGSDAMMLAGPAADPEAHARRHRLIVESGSKRAIEALATDQRDEPHPDWVVGDWEIQACQALGHDRRDRITLGSGIHYLRSNVAVLARHVDFGLDVMAAELSACISWMEREIGDSPKPRKGAPCPMCGKADLVQELGDDPEGSEDLWACPRSECGQWWTDADYRTKVAASYALVAEALTASQIAEVYRVPEATVRKWASRGQVARAGYDGQRRQLYVVADVLRMRDRESAA